ncbi:MAG: glycoside hydrolase family 127 protein [Ruminococcaceae bacterium]|nr:glycoside hydrolase family 127 protein [Oscillospiraceae bacterium]
MMQTKMLGYENVTITGGFWEKRQQINRKTTIWNVYKRFKETGRFDAFKMNWKEGDPNKPHIFWDSDVAKWLESVAYLTMQEREPELEAIVDEVVDCIERGQAEDGYFNIYYLMFAPECRFTNRGAHELYCAGHLLEAAIAYDKATGKGKFLACMKKYMKLIYRVFITEDSAAFDSPGHEEIELALVKLYDYTGEAEWLELAKYFVDARGSHRKLPEGDNYNRYTQIQDHVPVREQTTAEGHAVRAVYLFSAMADLAHRCDDAELKSAAETLFANITEKKMYITGSIGSALHTVVDGRMGGAEAFEEEYRLPNDTAYAETCAALGLALFARRMQQLDADSRYADTVERVIYNGFLSGVSLDGKSFFYENAQEIDLEQRRLVRECPRDNSYLHYPITQRVEVFGCSCCPPNVTRFIASIGDFLYNYTDDTIIVNQYMQSEATIGGVKLTQTTNYPYDGAISVKLEGGAKRLALRIPGWCRRWTLTKNGAPIKPETVKGYAWIDAADGDELCLTLSMEPRRIKADPHIMTNRGLSAVMYGPFVMCMEGVDNGGWLGDVKLTDHRGTLSFDETLGVPVLDCPAVRETVAGLYSDEVTQSPFTARLIPYFAFANRGESDMRIWVEIGQ